MLLPLQMPQTKLIKALQVHGIFPGQPSLLAWHCPRYNKGLQEQMGVCITSFKYSHCGHCETGSPTEGENLNGLAVGKELTTKVI